MNSIWFCFYDGVKKSVHIFTQSHHSEFTPAFLKCHRHWPVEQSNKIEDGPHPPVPCGLVDEGQGHPDVAVLLHPAELRRLILIADVARFPEPTQGGLSLDHLVVSPWVTSRHSRVSGTGRRLPGTCRPLLVSTSRLYMLAGTLSTPPAPTHSPARPSLALGGEIYALRGREREVTGRPRREKTHSKILQTLENWQVHLNSLIPLETLRIKDWE